MFIIVELYIFILLVALYFVNYCEIFGIFMSSTQIQNFIVIHLFRTNKRKRSVNFSMVLRTNCKKNSVFPPPCTLVKKSA